MNIIRILKKPFVPLAIMGIIFLLVTGLLVDNAKRYETSEKVPITAKVTTMEEYDNSTSEDDDRGYHVYVSYRFQFENYENVLFKDEPLDTEMKVGDKVDVEIYLDSPGEIAQDTSFMAWIFGAAGVICILWALISLLKSLGILRIGFR